MAVASGPTGPVLAGSVFEIVFGIVQAQNSNNVATWKTAIMHVPINAYLATSCAALKTCSNAKLPAASINFTSCVDSNHLTVDIYTWSRRWSLTTPPEGRSRVLASSIIYA